MPSRTRVGPVWIDGEGRREEADEVRHGPGCDHAAADGGGAAKQGGGGTGMG